MTVLMAFLIAGVPEETITSSTFPADTPLTPVATLSPAHSSSAALPSRISNITTKDNSSGLTMMLEVVQVMDEEMETWNLMQLLFHMKYYLQFSCFTNFHILTKN